MAFVTSTSSADSSTRSWADRWDFVSYEEYLRHQRDRARRSRNLTKGYGRHRVRLAELARRYCPEASSALCLGARHPIEIEDFRKQGFEVQGIDLYADESIRSCDMTRLDEDPELCDRRFDVFFSLFAVEHCYDFERFKAVTLPRCRSLIAVAVPLQPRPKVSKWNCIAFDFQRPEALPEDFERAFPGFELVYREKDDGVLRFVLRRRREPSSRSSNDYVALPTSMKNVMVANHIPRSRCSRDTLDRLLYAQIENSLEVGWRPEDILLVTNFPFSAQGVIAEQVELDTHCPRGSKMFAIERLLNRFGSSDAILWAHDLDCWQNGWFEPPTFADVGACEYSLPKFNGGSVFWRPTAIDIATEIVRRLRTEQASREEPTLNAVFKEKRYRRRVTILNPTYNVGCSGYKERLLRSEKPVRACHFHPTNRLAWGTHILNRHNFAERSASPRLEAVLRRWYPDLPTTFI